MKHVFVVNILMIIIIIIIIIISQTKLPLSSQYSQFLDIVLDIEIKSMKESKSKQSQQLIKSTHLGILAAQIDLN